jgi:hypothetical protein
LKEQDPLCFSNFIKEIIMRERRLVSEWAAVAAVLFCSFLSFACSGGNGDSNTQTGLEIPDVLGGQEGIAFAIGDDTYVFPALAAQFKSILDYTCVLGAKGDPPLYSEAIHIYFPGNTTGIFTHPAIDEKLQIGILLDLGSGPKYYSWEAGGDSWFLIEVTSYGAVGQRIEGTFEGKLVSEDGAETIDVSDGIFSVTRHPDF